MEAPAWLLEDLKIGGDGLHALHRDVRAPLQRQTDSTNLSGLGKLLKLDSRPRGPSSLLATQPMGLKPTGILTGSFLAISQRLCSCDPKASKAGPWKSSRPRHATSGSQSPPRQGWAGASRFPSEPRFVKPFPATRSTS